MFELKLELIANEIIRYLEQIDGILLYWIITIILLNIYF